PAPQSDAPVAAGKPYAFAPYVDMSSWPAPDFNDIDTRAGVKDVSLGFVVADKDTHACTPTWGGYKEYPAGGSDAYELAGITALKAAGGDGVPSFGGFVNQELATVCGSVDELANAYQQVIDAYGATHIDFDIEGDTLDNA